MVTAGKTGYLKWQDTSTGQLVAEARTRLGACTCCVKIRTTRS